MSRTLSPRLATIAVAAALCGTAGAVETVTYATPQGEVRTAEIVAVLKDELKDFSARIREGGRRTTLAVPSRLVVSYRRGDEDDVNPWTKRLAKAYQMMAEGNWVTKDKVPGAEEVLQGIALTTEKGVQGPVGQQVEPADPWHNMYALFHLIKTRYEYGRATKDAALLDKALKDVEQFALRSDKRRGALIDFEVPAAGAEGEAKPDKPDKSEKTRKSKVWAWGDSRLMPDVMLLKAQILRAQGKVAEAATAYDDAAKYVEKHELSPLVLAQAILDRAEMEADGKTIQEAEQLLRAAGNTLRTLASRQKEKWCQGVVGQAGNRALLRGADLLLASADQKQLGYTVPLEKYRELLDGPGKDDPFLATGARTGIGICLYETGKGKDSYQALLEVAVRAAEFPEQTARAFYYLGLAAPLYANEVDASGGSGGLLREDGARWWNDLRERFPDSPWAKKAAPK